MLRDWRIKIYRRLGRARLDEVRFISNQLQQPPSSTSQKGRTASLLSSVEQKKKEIQKLPMNKGTNQELKCRGKFARRKSRNIWPRFKLLITKPRATRYQSIYLLIDESELILGARGFLLGEAKKFSGVLFGRGANSHCR